MDYFSLNEDQFLFLIIMKCYINPQNVQKILIIQNIKKKKAFRMIKYLLVALLMVQVISSERVLSVTNIQTAADTTTAQQSSAKPVKVNLRRSIVVDNVQTNDQNNGKAYAYGHAETNQGVVNQQTHANLVRQNGQGHVKNSIPQITEENTQEGTQKTAHQNERAANKTNNRDNENKQDGQVQTQLHATDIPQVVSTPPVTQQSTQENTFEINGQTYHLTNPAAQGHRQNVVAHQNNEARKNKQQVVPPVEPVEPVPAEQVDPAPALPAEPAPAEAVQPSQAGLQPAAAPAPV